MLKTEMDKESNGPFGGCPTCGGMDGYRNIGRDHWVFCLSHRFKWAIGTNLFSGWRDENEADWTKNRMFLDQFQQTDEEPRLGTVVGSAELFDDRPF